MICKECDKLQKEKVCSEARCEVLVQQLKDESCKVRFEQQEDAHFEFQDIDDRTNECLNYMLKRNALMNPH